MKQGDHMSKQSRRSVSVKGLTYQRVKNYVFSRGNSLSSFLESAIVDAIGRPTDEDRRKFGELLEAREKASEAKAAKEKTHEPSKIPDPPQADKPGESVAATAPHPVAYDIETTGVGTDSSGDVKIAVVMSDESVTVEPLPKLEVKSVPKEAPPEPELPSASSFEERPVSRPYKQKIPGVRTRTLSKGNPAAERESEVTEDPEGFEGYVPPILQF